MFENFTLELEKFNQFSFLNLTQIFTLNNKHP